MKVLIAGGAGFIGYYLALRHVQDGDDVTIVDNLSKSDGRADALFEKLITEPGVEYLDLDLTHPTGLPPKSYEVVYHLAAINGTRLFYEIPYELAKTNLLITLNLLDVLEHNPPARLVYASSSEVYAEAATLGLLTVPTDETVPVIFTQPTPARFSYGTSKFMGEFLCSYFGKKYNTPTTTIRYHNIYGPRMGNKHVIPEFIARARIGENPFKVYGGKETRAFCYVEDAVTATKLVASMATGDSEIIHIGNPKEEIAIKDLARLILEKMNVDVPIEVEDAPPGSVSRRCPDISKLKSLTRFEPKFALDQGLDTTLEWYLAN